MAQSSVVYLRKDRQERYNLKRGWFVNAWRIVDADGTDRIQPWSSTKGEAIATARASGLIVGGLWTPPAIAEPGKLMHFDHP
jgi:hypothetical protein